MHVALTLNLIYVTEKSSHLLSLLRGSDRWRWFRADLQEERSFDEAVKGCDGVFHIAASMEFHVNDREDVGNACYKCLF